MDGQTTVRRDTNVEPTMSARGGAAWNAQVLPLDTGGAPVLDDLVTPIVVYWSVTTHCRLPLACS